MEKTEEQLRQECGQALFKAGQIQYQIVNLQKDLELVMNTIRDLNLEAVKLGAKASAAQKEEQGEAQNAQESK